MGHPCRQVLEETLKLWTLPLCSLADDVDGSVRKNAPAYKSNFAIGVKQKDLSLPTTSHSKPFFLEVDFLGYSE